MISPQDTFSELVQFTKEFRGEKADGLIIVPFYKAYDYLFKHLKLLEAQTFQDFDLIIVMGASSDEKKVIDFINQNKFRYGIIVAKTKEDTGAAGGFFTGERYALENGYKYVIIADDDCLPVNKQHIETLVEEHRKGNPLVYARVAFVLDGEEVHYQSGLPYYSLVDIGLLRKAGLHFAPLYIGGDDGEFEARLFRLAKPLRTESKVTHPKEHSIFVDFERSVRYRINEMLLDIPEHSDIYLYDIALVSLCYLIFGTPAVRKGGFHMLYCAIIHRYGPDAAKGFKSAPGFAQEELKFDRIVTPLASQKGKEYFLYQYGAGQMIKHLLELAVATFRKKALLMPINTFGALVSMIVAKETWVSSRAGHYLLAENRNAFIHLLKLFLFGLLFPPFLVLAVLTLLLNLARKPKTMGYGI